MLTVNVESSSEFSKFKADTYDYIADLLTEDLKRDLIVNHALCLHLSLLLDKLEVLDAMVDKEPYNSLLNTTKRLIEDSKIHGRILTDKVLLSYF